MHPANRQTVDFLELAIEIARGVVERETPLVTRDTVIQLRVDATRRRAHSPTYKARSIIGDEIVLMAQCLENVLAYRACGDTTTALRWAWLARAFLTFLRTDLALLQQPGAEQPENVFDL